MKKMKKTEKIDRVTEIEMALAGLLASLPRNENDPVADLLETALISCGDARAILQSKKLVQQVEQLLPAANLQPALKNEVHAALDELKEAANSTSPDSGRLRKGLEYLKRVLAPAGDHALKALVDAAVAKLLGP
jgi:hypothetical protein